MTRENLPILYQNVMDGLATEIGRDAFLWATERRENDHMCYKAEAFAREVDLLARTLRPWVEVAMAEHDGTGGDTDDLMAFILTRHAGYRHGGNVKPSYVRENAP